MIRFTIGHITNLVANPYGIHCFECDTIITDIAFAEIENQNMILCKNCGIHAEYFQTIGQERY